tara:strand:- start:9258 stop:10589 length:1332 start_codon:yes stop_codon:yes gene_type:complete
MNFDFPIDEIKFVFDCHGTAKIQIFCNKKIIKDHSITKEILKEENSIDILFSKDDPADTNSFAELESVTINGYEYKDKFKFLPYTIDSSYHKVNSSINNNNYFGYVGSMSFTVNHKIDLLSQAAYTIADKEFEYVKWPMVQGPHYREKTLDNLNRDTKFMHIGSLAPKTQEIIDFIDVKTLKEFKFPLKVEECRKHIQEWINKSTRIQIDNFESMQQFNFSNGIIPCLESFANRSNTLYITKKAYYFYRYFENYSHKIKDLFEDEILENSHVLIEFPTLYYSKEELQNKIKEAKEKNCTIALDLTWLPISVEPIDIDLDYIDEVYFSMNKTWPVDDIRPAWRWSKQKIKDSITFEMEITIYPKIPANLFISLINEFSFDYVYDKYRDPVAALRKTFKLSQSPILWFTKHDSYVRNEPPIFPGYYMDEYVCVRKLLDYKEKYWW